MAIKNPFLSLSGFISPLRLVLLAKLDLHSLQPTGLDKGTAKSRGKKNASDAQNKCIEKLCLIIYICWFSICFPQLGEGISRPK